MQACVLLAPGSVSVSDAMLLRIEQKMVEGLTSKKPSAVQLHKEALEDMEEFCGVRLCLASMRPSPAYHPSSQSGWHLRF